MRNKSNVLKGIAAAPGIAIAKAHIFERESEKISSAEIKNVEEAIIEFEEALEKSRKELRKIFSMAIDKLGENRAAIFEAQILILDDPILKAKIIERIREEKIDPTFIVSDEISKYQLLMDNSGEAYLRERSHDIEDIKNRIIRNLKKKKWISKIAKDVIVVSHNITPSDTLLFTRVDAKGYVTDIGGLTSHAAIVARSLNIPAVVGVHDASSLIENGDTLVIDGYHGEIVINPNTNQRKYYNGKIKLLNKFSKELKKLKDLPAETLDGHRINLAANLDLMEEIEFVINNGAEGIGLARTEQLFDLLNSFPDEEEQYKLYLELAQKVYPNTVTIRTFDIGGDKVLPVDVKQPNPFLGWRGIRFLLDNQDLFMAQLKAILRANVNRNIKIMIPMVTSVWEIKKTLKLLEECAQILRNEGIEHEMAKLGIMVEVPSAAVLAKSFAEQADFFSIGTNDLIQYVLAVDRGNEIVSDMYQEFHPAVLRTLDFIIHGGSSQSIPTAICGEMAADPLAVPLLVGMGLDTLSVSASAIPNIKKIIRSLKFTDLQILADACLNMHSEQEIYDHLLSFYKSKISESIEDLI